MSIFSSWNRRRAEKRAEEQAKARSDEIDVNIAEESKSFKQLYNVLLISISESESAASAFIKRMKTLHEGHPRDELTYEQLVDFRPVIWRILLLNSRSIVRAIRSRNLGPARRSNKANCEYIMNHRTDTDSPEFSFLPKFGRAIQDLWAEEIIPVLLDDPSGLSVDDNAAYFFSEAQRIVAEEYVPSIEDIPRAAEKGIKETYFKMDQISIRVLQVCGQEGERRNWIDLFGSITSIIFYVSLSDYDEKVAGWCEQAQVTRLAESLARFEAVVNSRCFLRASVIIVLSDMSKFRTKIHEVPLARYYPEYTGGADANEGAEFILRRFVELNSSGLTVYAHIIEISNLSDLRMFFAAMSDTILRNTVVEAGIL